MKSVVAAAVLELSLFCALLEPAGAMPAAPARDDALEKVWYGAQGDEQACRVETRTPNALARLSESALADRFSRNDCRFRLLPGPEGVAAILSCGRGEVVMVWADSVEGCEFLVEILRSD